MDGKKDDKDTSSGKVVSKETSGEPIETKPEAVKAIDRKAGRFVIAGKLNRFRTGEIDGC